MTGPAAVTAAYDDILKLAQQMGLRPYPTHFQVVPAHIMYEFGAYGIPGRFNHWTRGKAYHQLKTGYDLGLSRIYELVINSDPCFGFLLETNSPLANKFVMAHVTGHSDFFRNNVYFQGTPRDMVTQANLHATRLRQYEFEHGLVTVEKFLDAVLSIQEHVDSHAGYVLPGRTRGAPRSGGEPARSRARANAARPSFEDLFPGVRGDDEPGEDESDFESTTDLLMFLQENSPVLEPWQRDVLSIVRSESHYFYPQLITKVINEGWASFWHLQLMRALELTDAEFTEFAQLHSSIQTRSPYSINPYLLGLAVLDSVYQAVNREHGVEPKTTLEPSPGRDALFLIRETEDDVSFLRNHLTEDIVESLDLYVFKLDRHDWKIVDKEWEAVRETLVMMRLNGGNPVIEVIDDDYRGNRELFLRHLYDGRELDREYARKTLQHVYRLWGRRVHLETVMDGKECVLSHSE